MQYSIFERTNYKFFSLGSGSSGNCYYLGSSECGILIDAGIGIRSVKKTLKEYGISFDKILGIIVTHHHADHIKTIGCLGDKHNIPVFATEAVHYAITRSRYVVANLTNTRRIIEKDTAFRIKDMCITAFDVPHDSIENVGYHIQLGEQVFVFITDVGRITDTIIRYAKDANHLVVEANYDEDMLTMGRYPEHLKQRIRSGMGHLSNTLSAQFVADIYTENLKNIWLCHLSQDNNTPDLAYSAVAQKLKEKGIVVGEGVRLEALSRHKASGLREF